METENHYDYDYFVIGGGSGGLASAKKAANLGAKVALADFVKPSPQGTTWGLGGTCVNVGCIPKKLFHFASSLGEIREDQKECGWDVDPRSAHNWERMIDHVHDHIKGLNWGYKKQLVQQNVDYFNELASLDGLHTIRLKAKTGEEKTKTAKYILLAMGGRPLILDLPGAQELCITSDDLFWRQQSPGKTLIIGAGYIAVECAGFIKGFGHSVDLLYRSVVLRAFDQDMGLRIQKYMEKSGIKFKKGNPISFEKTENGIKAKMKIEIDGQLKEVEEIYDTVLMAVGRSPDVKSIGVEKFNIKLDVVNKIIVSDKWETSIPNVFAIGDIMSESRELTPIAIKEGIYLAEGLFSNKWRKIDYRSVATTIFSPLEYSCSGYSEAEAIEEFGDKNIEIYHTGFKPLEWNFLDSRTNEWCYAKIIVHIPDEKILGIHYVGPNAGEVMQGYSIAVRLGLKYQDLKETLGIHPTTAEELVGLTKTKRSDPDATTEGC